MDKNKVFEDVERWLKNGEYGRHSDYQIQHFIAGKEAINEFGGYKQMLREVDTRYVNMKNDYLEVQELQLKIKKLDNKIAIAEEKKNDIRDDNSLSVKMIELLINEIDLDIEEYELEKNKHLNRIKQLEGGLKKNLTELDRFYTLAKHFEEKVKEKEAKGISMQDQETEYWERRMQMYAYLGMCGATGSLMDSILALPSDSREKVIKYLNDANMMRQNGQMISPPFITNDDCMLSNTDVLELHSGSSEKKEFYALDIGISSEYVGSLIKALEEKN